MVILRVICIMGLIVDFMHGTKVHFLWFQSLNFSSNLYGKNSAVCRHYVFRCDKYCDVRVGNVGNCGQWPLRMISLFILEQPRDLLKLIVRLIRIRGGGKKDCPSCFVVCCALSSDSDQQLRKLQSMKPCCAFFVVLRLGILKCPFFSVLGMWQWLFLL